MNVGSQDLAPWELRRDATYWTRRLESARSRREAAITALRKADDDITKAKGRLHALGVEDDAR